MGKKKAIKLATATAIAASAFVAVAPTQSEAATSSVDKAITKASSAMLKAFNTYNKTARVNHKLPALATIKKDVKSAQDAYAAAAKEIASKGGTKAQKAALTKELDTNKKYLDRAEQYLKAVTTNLNPTKKAFTEAVASGKQSTVSTTQAAYQAKIEEFEANVAKVYGPDARDLLTAKYADAANKLVNSVNDEMKVYKAYKAIEKEELIKKDLEAAFKEIDGAKEEAAKIAKLDTTLAKNITKAVEKNNKKFEDTVQAAVTIEGITDGEKTDEETKTITVKATKGSEIKVTLNGTAVAANENGSYTLKLQEGSNKVAVESTVYGVKTELNKEITSNQTPAVKSVSAINAKEIEVTFNKPVKASTIVAPAGATLPEVAGTLINGAVKINNAAADSLGASLSEDGKTLTITAATSFDGSYAFELVKDKVETVDGKAVAPTVTNFVANDTSRPEVKNVQYLSNSKVRVFFSEPLATVTPTNYTYADGSAITAGGITETFTPGNDYIEYTLTKANLTVGKNIVVSFTDATDYNGNINKPTTATFKYDNSDQTAPTFVSSVATSPTTFDLKFSEDLDSATAGKIKVNGVAVTTAVVDSKDKTLVHVTTTAQTNAVAVTLDAAAVQDLNGNDSAATSTLVNFAVDKVAPQVVNAAVQRVNGVESLVLTYNENVVPQSTVAVDFKSVDADGVDQTVSKSVTPVLYNAVDGVSKSVSINLNTILLVDDTNYTADFAASLVKDQWGNSAVANKGVKFSTTKIANATGKLVATLPASNATPGVINISFDQKLDPTSAKNVANYTVEDATVKEAKLTANAGGVYTVQLVLNDSTVKTSGHYKVTVKDVKPASPSASVVNETSALVDLTENVRPTAGTVAVKTLAATSIVDVTFSEAITDANADTDYALYVDGTLVPGATVTNTEAGNVVTFSIVEDLTDELTQGKKVELRALSTIDLKDAAGNLVNAPVIVIK
ncbi:hypothetical protein ACIQXQ_01745 [Peribacillus sp. NPDC097198]|uniref:hypothetical protein n=1 Tax=Peribacillus sp. NPDC097198 TaxID=3364397 RepID=UPI00381DD480